MEKRLKGHTQVQHALVRYCSPRVRLGEAVAIDAKRIRGADRNEEDHYETVTLV